MLKKKPDPSARLKAHVDTTAKVTAMIARCARLRDAGRLTEARRSLVHIEKLTAELNGLEG